MSANGALPTFRARRECPLSGAKWTLDTSNSSLTKPTAGYASPVNRSRASCSRSDRFPSRNMANALARMDTWPKSFHERIGEFAPDWPKEGPDRQLD